MVSAGFGTVQRHHKSVRVEMMIPLEVSRAYGQLRRDLLSQFLFMEHEREDLARQAGSYFDSRARDYDFISRALACVYIHAIYPKQRAPLIALAKIGETSFAKYKKILEEENKGLSLDCVAIKLRGNQVKYTAENDAKFLAWLKNPIPV